MRKSYRLGLGFLKSLYVYTCVQNMVGPGEVDEELESETADECSKYGKVIKCLIFEVSVTVNI